MITETMRYHVVNINRNIAFLQDRQMEIHDHKDFNMVVDYLFITLHGANIVASFRDVNYGSCYTEVNCINVLNAINTDIKILRDAGLCIQNGRNLKKCISNISYSPASKKILFYEELANETI